MKKALTFDIGGTKIYSTIIDEEGNIVGDIEKFSTPKSLEEIKKYQHLTSIPAVGTLPFDVEYKEICVWGKELGGYNFGTKQRKNASWNNTTFALISLPIVKFYFENEDISIYDYIIYISHVCVFL